MGIFFYIKTRIYRIQRLHDREIEFRRLLRLPLRRDINATFSIRFSRERGLLNRSFILVRARRRRDKFVKTYSDDFLCHILKNAFLLLMYLQDGRR